MKTSTIPSLRVKPELRQAAESVLRDGETLSSFMEESLRASIRQRKARAEFIARGLASRAESQRTNQYFSTDDVLNELNGILSRAESKDAP